MHVPQAAPLEVTDKLLLAVLTAELLILETVNVVVGNEAEVTGAVQTLIQGLGEAAGEITINETGKILGELCLLLGGVEPGGNEFNGGVQGGHTVHISLVGLIQQLYSNTDDMSTQWPEES